MKGKWCLAKLFVVFKLRSRTIEKLFQMFRETWSRASSTQPSAVEKGRGTGRERREKEGNYRGCVYLTVKLNAKDGRGHSP